jgi:hypothetical protein
MVTTLARVSSIPIAITTAQGVRTGVVVVGVEGM